MTEGRDAHREQGSQRKVGVVRLMASKVVETLFIADFRVRVYEARILTTRLDSGHTSGGEKGKPWATTKTSKTDTISSVPSLQVEIHEENLCFVSKPMLPS